MASSIFSLALIFLFIINLSYASDLITKVCSKTQNQPLCYQTLKSDPRSAKSDLKGLGFISIEKSKNDATQTYNYVVSLSKQAGSDFKLKNRYDTCVENYDDAIGELDDSKKALDSGDISSFRTYSSSAIDYVGTCEDSFEGPPAAPPKLQEANKKSQGLIGIVLAVGALLDGQ